MDAVDLIKKHSALRLTCYDSATGAAIVAGYTVLGHPMLGYGRALDTDGFTPDEATALVVAEVPHRTADLQVIFGPRWAALGAARQAALIDLHYALTGAGIRQLHDVITALGNQQWDVAADLLLATSQAKSDVMGRYVEDAEILRAGVMA